MNLEVGAKAPTFTLGDAEGNKVALKDFLGKKTIILYFYPKDATPGCTQQACDFRDFLPELKKQGAVVLGISRDSVASHRKFSDKFQLNFPLLADEEGKVCEQYGVWQEKKLYGKAFMGIVRTTFVIGTSGLIEQIYTKVKVNGHVETLLASL